MRGPIWFYKTKTRRSTAKQLASRDAVYDADRFNLELGQQRLTREELFDRQRRSSDWNFFEADP